MRCVDASNPENNQPIFLLMGKSASGEDTVFSMLCPRLGIGTYSSASNNGKARGTSATDVYGSNRPVVN